MSNVKATCVVCEKEFIPEQFYRQQSAWIDEEVTEKYGEPHYQLGEPGPWETECTNCLKGYSWGMSARNAGVDLEINDDWGTLKFTGIPKEFQK